MNTERIILTRNGGVVRSVVAVWICLTMMGGGIAYAQNASSSRPSNVEQLQKIVRVSIEQVIADGGIVAGQRIIVKNLRDENSWLVDQVTFNALTSHGVRIAVSGAADTSSVDATLEFVTTGLGIRYTPVFHDGLFGQSRTERIAEGKFSASMTGKDGSIRLAKIYSRSLSDTIAVDEIPAIEHPSLRSARGDPPEMGFFDTLLEPAVIIGAIAIAVYLLFTVRS